jgi:hypothetical protein
MLIRAFAGFFHGCHVEPDPIVGVWLLSPDGGRIKDADGDRRR